MTRKKLQTRREQLLYKILFLQKRHPESLDMDYVRTLSEKDLEAVLEYAMEVNGQGEDPEAKKAANHSRYMRHRADAMGVIDHIPDYEFNAIADPSPNPEEILLFKEEVELRLAEREKRKK